ncbi:ATP-binding protein [Geodermatophilus sp. SYSU D00965]
MSVSVWAHHPPPVRDPHRTATWEGQPGSTADLAVLRRRVRAALHDGSLPTGTDDGERLLLVVEELVSNALRHGRPPVHVTVTAAVLGWLVAVSDAAPGRPPTPALDRDPGLGGMGLSLVARMCGARGWVVEDGRKVVWARVPYREPLPPDRLQEVTRDVLALATRLVASAVQVAATLEELARDADEAGRAQVAGRYRNRAARARLDAERARWVVLTAAASGGHSRGEPVGRPAPGEPTPPAEDAAG